MKEKLPATVSVITTFYNSEKHIVNCIKSILNQTFNNYEHILIDDGSSDSSVELINKIADKRIKLIRPGRIGRSKSLNCGLNAASGKYIAILDADDFALPNRLELQLKQFQIDNSLSLVCSNAFIINNNNKVKGSLNYPEDHDNLIKHIINLNPFPHSTVMFDKKILKTVKGYNERCKKSVDFNFYLELLINQAKFKCVQTPLIKLFLDEGTWGKQDDEALQFRYGLIGLVNYLQKVNGGMGILDLNEDEWIKSKNKFDEWFNKKGFLFRVNAKRKLNQSRCSLHNNNYLEAIINLFKAFIHDPYFFMYRGLGLKFPQDINEIISILNQN